MPEIKPRTFASKILTEADVVISHYFHPSKTINIDVHATLGTRGVVREIPYPWVRLPQDN